MTLPSAIDWIGTMAGAPNEASARPGGSEGLWVAGITVAGNVAVAALGQASALGPSLVIVFLTVISASGVLLAVLLQRRRTRRAAPAAEDSSPAPNGSIYVASAAGHEPLDDYIEQTNNQAGEGSLGRFYDAHRDRDRDRKRTRAAIRSAPSCVFVLEPGPRLESTLVDAGMALSDEDKFVVLVVREGYEPPPLLAFTEPHERRVRTGFSDPQKLPVILKNFKGSLVSGKLVASEKRSAPPPPRT